MPKEFPYKPGQLVGARFAGYGWWPSVIIANCHTPDHVKEELSNLEDDSIAYVVFMGDRTFGAASCKNLKPLSTEEAEKQMKLKKSKKDKNGYLDALQYDDYWKLLFEMKLMKEIVADEIPSTIYDKPRKTKRSSSSEITPKTSKKRKSIEPKSEVKVEKVETPESLKEEAYQLRVHLQKRLIQKDTLPTDEELEDGHKYLIELENFSPKITVDILRHSKLHKVLKVISRSDGLQEKKPEYKFRERSQRLILAWEGFIKILIDEKLRDTPNVSIDVKDDKNGIKVSTP